MDINFQSVNREDIEKVISTFKSTGLYSCSTTHHTFKILFYNWHERNNNRFTHNIKISRDGIDVTSEYLSSNIVEVDGYPPYYEPVSVEKHFILLPDGGTYSLFNERAQKIVTIMRPCRYRGNLFTQNHLVLFGEQKVLVFNLTTNSLIEVALSSDIRFSIDWCAVTNNNSQLAILYRNFTEDRMEVECVDLKTDNRKVTILNEVVFLDNTPEPGYRRSQEYSGMTMINYANMVDSWWFLAYRNEGEIFGATRWLSEPYEKNGSFFKDMDIFYWKMKVNCC